MAGYLGNNPADSSVRIARQIYTTSGVTTDFTFTSGYDPGYIDVYVNGERQTEGTNFTASDGSTVIILNGGVSTGSTVECAAYKTFNVATVTLGEVTDVDDLTITGAVNAGSGAIGIATINSSGIDAGVGVITAASYVGDGSSLTGIASTDIINAEQVNVSGSTTTGIATVSTSVVVGSAVTVTATAISINPTVTTTVGDSGIVNFNDDAKARFGTGNDLSLYHNGTNSLIDNTTGTFYLRGDDLQLTDYSATDKYVDCTSNGSVDLYYNNSKKLETIAIGGKVTGELQVTGDSNVAGVSTVTGDLSIADKIVHTGDTDTAIRFSDADEIKFETGGSERLKIKSNGNLFVNTSTFVVNASGNQVAINTTSINAELEIQSTTDPKIRLQSQESGNKRLELWIDGGTAVGYIAANQSGSTLQFQTTNTTALTLDASQNATFAGTVADSKGNVRSIIQNTQGSTYTLVAGDAGKHILASGTVTIPNSIFSAGDAVTIVNNTAGDLTLTASVGTLYNTADASTGDRTLATRGMATILFSSATAAYISGAGLS